MPGWLGSRALGWQQHECSMLATGFYSAFLGNGFKERMMARLEEIIGGLQVDASQLRIFVTGALPQIGGRPAAQREETQQQQWRRRRDV